jgi:hypothetical protein
MAKRDDTLQALLPPVGSPYSFDNLNEAETKALEEALGDVKSNFGIGSLAIPAGLPALRVDGERQDRERFA